MNANELLPVIFGAGGVAFLGACVQAWKSWKDSAEARESKAMRNVERWNDECWNDLIHERRWGAYWYRIAAIYEYHMYRKGVTPPSIPEPPVDPRWMPSPAPPTPSEED